MTYRRFLAYKNGYEGGGRIDLDTGVITWVPGSHPIVAVTDVLRSMSKHLSVDGFKTTDGFQVEFLDREVIR